MSNDENSCELCQQFPRFNARLQASIDELEAGGGERFDTLEELFESWRDDDTEDAIFQEIANLLQDNDYDDDFLKPTDFAVNEAKRMLSACAQYNSSYPTKSRVSTDGSGGIRLEWSNGNKEVRLVINAAQAELSYIYYQSDSAYHADRIPTVENLLKRLRWLEDNLIVD